jgi:hypothetical protein
MSSKILLVVSGAVIGAFVTAWVYSLVPKYQLAANENRPVLRIHGRTGQTWLLTNSPDGLFYWEPVRESKAIPSP